MVRHLRKIVIDGCEYYWLLRNNSLFFGDGHIHIYGSKTGQKLILDALPWDFEIRPKSVAAAIRFGLNCGWKPNSSGQPIYLGYVKGEFIRLTDGKQFTSQLLGNKT